ncbi:MAG: universal stress protein [Woeseiaceae bacterium]
MSKLRISGDAAIFYAGHAKKCTYNHIYVGRDVKSNPKILVVVEPNYEPFVVVKRAVWLAKLMNCDLQLALCDPTANPLPIAVIATDKAGEFARAIKQAQVDLVDELASIARDEGVTVTTEIVEDRSVAEAVIERADKSRPEYVVKGTQFHSTAERSMLVDTDWYLARTCPFPIWFVKASEFGDAPLIVAAVDPTHSHDKPAVLDDTIIQSAKFVSERLGGELHLFHSYHRLTEISSRAIKTIKPVKLEIEKIDKKIKREHRDALDALAKRNDIDDKFVHQLPGRTSELLPAFVRTKKAQLVVMGALSRWGLKRMVIGSTAERVMDHLPCDILIVKPSTESDLDH